MTITYRDGKSVQAVLLSRDETTLRTAFPGGDDTQTFHFLKGAWISETCEPVTIEFEWQSKKRENSPTETDCVCSKQLAARLIHSLYHPEQDELQEQLQRLFLADGASGIAAGSESVIN